MKYRERLNSLLSKIKTYNEDRSRIFIPGYAVDTLSEIFILDNNYEELTKILTEEELSKMDKEINESFDLIEEFYIAKRKSGENQNRLSHLIKLIGDKYESLQEFTFKYHQSHGINVFAGKANFNKSLPANPDDSYYQTIADGIKLCNESGVPFFKLSENERRNNKLPLVMMRKLPPEVCILSYFMVSDKELLTLIAERNYKELFGNLGPGTYYATQAFLEPYVEKDYRILIPLDKRRHNVKQEIIDKAIAHMTDEQIEELLDSVAKDYKGYFYSTVSKIYLRNADIAFRLYQKLDPKDFEAFFHDLSPEVRSDKNFIEKCIAYNIENKKIEENDPKFNEDFNLNSVFVTRQNRNDIEINKSFVVTYMKKKYNVDDVDDFIINHTDEFVHLIRTLPFQESNTLRNYCIYNPKFKKIVMKTKELRDPIVGFNEDSKMDLDKINEIYTIDDHVRIVQMQECSTLSKKLEVPFRRDYAEKHKDEEPSLLGFLRDFILSDKLEALYAYSRFNINDINFVTRVINYFDKNERKATKARMNAYASKYYKIYLGFYNDVVRSQDNDQRLEEIFKLAGLNRNNIYDFIFNNKYYEKSLKNALLLIAKKHYKDKYISIGDIVSLIDEMASKELTLDEILKAKDIDKKLFNKILEDLSINNPYIYDYIKGKLQNNKIRGLIKHIRKGKKIIETNIESREHCIELFGMTPEDIIKSYESLDLYEAISTKLNPFLDQTDVKKK